MDKTTLVLGILLGAAGMYILIHLLWHFGYFALASVMGFLGGIRTDASPVPRSLDRMEAMILPRVLKDFPDFQPENEKDLVREHLKKEYAGHPEFQVEALGLTDYRPENSSLIYQAAVSFQEKKLRRRRVRITVEPRNMACSSVCPDCGAPLVPGDRHCRSCGKKLAETPSVLWTVSQIREL